MASGRAETGGRTLRSHLTFWNTTVLLLLVSVTLVGLRAALYWTVLRELDHLLREDADEVALLLRSKYPQHALIGEALERKARSHREDGWFVDIYRRDGSLYQSTRGHGEAAPGGEFQGGVSKDGTRLALRELEGEEGDLSLVRVGASLAGVEEDVARLTKLLVVVGVLIVGIAPLVGWFLAGRATRPLAAILRTTRRLRPDQLGERLPLTGTNDELDRLSTTINAFLDQLARHLRQQREFVANAAHELRSPLTALYTAIDIALQRDRPGEEYRDLLGGLAEECQSLRTLVNQLLLLAESDAGVLQPGDTPLRLDELVQRSTDMVQGVAEQREVELVVEQLGPVTVRGHATHLRQVIHNLLDNAIKFTPVGGRVGVALTHTREGGAELLVRDNGCGIPADRLGFIFDRFYRLDAARQRDQGGSGLGLCICQSIVKAYGGDIRVESVLGQGTLVRVLLPCAPASLTEM